MFIYIPRKWQFLILFLTISFVASAINKDSLKLSVTDKKKKFLIGYPGYLYIGDEHRKQIGYAIVTHIDYETFFYKNLSLIYRIGGQYFYLKHEGEAIDLEGGLCIRKYFRIRNSSKLFVYSSLGFIRHSIKDFKTYGNFNHYIGVFNSTGCGIHIIPLLKKNKISRIGLDIGFSVFTNYKGAYSAFNFLGLKYRLN